MQLPLFGILRDEFHAYGFSDFQKDFIAGLTVAAAAFPLSLAFGVASGGSPAAGLLAAIVAGLVVGALGGTPNLVSGPTGAMSAVLLVVAKSHGFEGIWITTLLAGIFILLIGVLRLGQLVFLIPRPVVIGFTGGIAVIIFVGQLANVFGIEALQGSSAAQRASDLIQRISQGAFQPNWQSFVIAAIGVAIIFLMPKAISRIVPAQLISVLATTTIAQVLHFQLTTVGQIPAALILPDHLTFGVFTAERVQALLLPAVSVAILCTLQALLSAAECANLTKRNMDTNWELIAQGLGNMLIPWLGGVPLTGAIARTKIAIASGGRTRLTTVIHAAVLVAMVFLVNGLIANIPLAALASVLIATAYRMNEWADIGWMFRHRFKSAIATFLLTLLATTYLDLTQAILLGLALSAVLFIYRVSNISVEVKPVDVAAMQSRGHTFEKADPHVRVAYITGPMFFATAAAFRRALEDVPDRALILSMRGVPAIDLSGLELIEELLEQMHQKGGELMLAAVQPAVKEMLDRSKLTEEIGANKLFWSADQAILAAHE